MREKDKTRCISFCLQMSLSNCSKRFLFGKKYIETEETVKAKQVPGRAGSRSTEPMQSHWPHTLEGSCTLTSELLLRPMMKQKGSNSEGVKVPLSCQANPTSKVPLSRGKASSYIEVNEPRLADQEMGSAKITLFTYGILLFHAHLFICHIYIQLNLI